MNNTLHIDDWDLYFFKLANLIARKSKDPSSIVGSVIVKDKRVLTTGYNGFCIGVWDFEERYADRETKYQFVAHSEFNACIVAARFGISICDSTLYTQTLPCENCAKAIIQAGVKTVKTLKSCEQLWANYSKNWADSKRITQIMFSEAEIKNIEYNIECGDKILIGGKIYEI